MSIGNDVFLYLANFSFALNSTRSREEVLADVMKDGLALQYASGQLREDREIVLAAVQENGLALEHASEKLREDREIVLAAFQENGLASLQYASEKLKTELTSK